MCIESVNCYVGTIYSVTEYLFNSGFLTRYCFVTSCVGLVREIIPHCGLIRFDYRKICSSNYLREAICHIKFDPV